MSDKITQFPNAKNLELINITTLQLAKKAKSTMFVASHNY